MRKCVICDKEFENSKNHKGKGCRGCLVNRHRHGRKEKMLAYKGGKCEKCGYNKCSRALSFHHINPNEKDFNISGSHSRKWTVLKKELDKCILLCHNCHSEEHFNRELEDNVKIKNRWKFYSKTKTKTPLPNIKCGNCGLEFKPKSYKTKFCSLSCSSKNQSKSPGKKELEDVIWKLPTTQIAKKYNVSDKAVEKWAKYYGIKKPPRGYWAKVKSGKIKQSDH